MTPLLRSGDYPGGGPVDGLALPSSPQVSSIGGIGTFPTLGLYNASMWALEGFSEALAAAAPERPRAPSRIPGVTAKAILRLVDAARSGDHRRDHVRLRRAGTGRLPRLLHRERTQPTTSAGSMSDRRSAE